MHLMRVYLASPAAAGQSQRQIVEAVLALTRTSEVWQAVLAHQEATKEEYVTRSCCPGSSFGGCSASCKPPCGSPSSASRAW